MSTRKLRYIVVVFSIFLLLTLVLGTVVQVFAAGMQSSTAFSGSRMIVVFSNEAASDVEKDAAVGETGGKKIKDLPLINGAVVEVGYASISAMGRDRRILRIEPDEIVHIVAQTEPWGIGHIKSDQVWDKDGDGHADPGANAGDGVKVAVIDTGIDLTHPDLAANIKGGASFVSGVASPNDDNGHGTHVAGTIAAIDDSNGVVGVAPKAYLYAVKVLDSTGSGYISDIISGIQWAVANRMQVVNMSFGGGGDVQAMHDAIIAASRAGIVLVAAAGNSGPGANTVGYPAKYPEVIAVGAHDRSNFVTSFSSRGPEVEVSAPGLSILSTTKGGLSGTMSGTSMASPHVAGAAALLIGSAIADANGNGVTNDEVRNALTRTAIDSGPTGRDADYGYGRIDVQAAIGYGAPPPPVAPTVTTSLPTSVGQMSATLNGDLSALGSASTVNVSFLWGTTTATTNETAPLARTATGSFSADLLGLTPGTTYYFKAKAAGASTAYGVLRSFVYRQAAPNVTTNAVTSMARTSATINGTLNSLGSAASVDVSFLWGTSTSALTETVPQSLTSTGTFSAGLTGLTPGVTYYVRAKATGDTTTYGSFISFRFAARPPLVATRPASAGRTSATLNGVLLSLGSAPAANVYFQWGTTSAMVNRTSPASMAAAGPFSAIIDGLTPGVRYYFRARAEGDGIAIGGTYTVIFLLRAPRVSSYSLAGAATSITSTSATLNGSLLDMGSATPVQVSFTWGTTTSVNDGETPPLTLTGKGTFSVELPGLASGTRYYYRAKVAGDGTRLGELRTFLTVP